MAAQAEKPNAQRADLQTRIKATPQLPLEKTLLRVQLPAGQKLGMVSWLTYDPKNAILWIIQRGDKANPIIAIDRSGEVLHSFGKGLFKIPHSIRLDPEGNVWTVDAGNSRIIKFSPTGKELLHFDVEEPKTLDQNFTGATDIAFTPNGRLLISDGYVNARILEYTTTGKKIGEWGGPGSNPGQFHLPHCVVVGADNIVYVADRENGRIEKFNLNGKYLGQIANLGRVYSLALGKDETLWATMSPLTEPPGSPGWIVKMDRRTGKILGYVPVNESPALHCLDLIGGNQPITDVGNEILWFKSGKHDDVFPKEHY